MLWLLCFSLSGVMVVEVGVREAECKEGAEGWKLRVGEGRVEKNDKGIDVWSYYTVLKVYVRTTVY
jgi:hypothetical protein